MDTEKIIAIKELLNDIMPDGILPSAADLNEDDELIVLYDTMHTLQEQLEHLGY